MNPKMIVLTALAWVWYFLPFLLLVAAYFKAQQVAQRSLGWDRLSAIAVILFECLLALWLLSRIRPLWAWRVTAACFVIFALSSLQKGIAGDESCGCFGSLKVNPWITFSIDCVVLTALWATRQSVRQSVAPEHDPFLSNPARVAAFGLVFGIVMWSSLSGRAARIGDGAAVLANARIIVLEPENWLGEQFPLGSHWNLRDSALAGQLTVVLYHHDCPACLRRLPEYERLARQGKRVALVEVPPFAPPGRDPVPANSACVRGRLDPSKEWFVQTPAVIELDEGRVVSVSLPKD